MQSKQLQITRNSLKDIKNNSWNSNPPHVLRPHSLCSVFKKTTVTPSCQYASLYVEEPFCSAEWALNALWLLVPLLGTLQCCGLIFTPHAKEEPLWSLPRFTPTLRELPCLRCYPTESRLVRILYGQATQAAVRQIPPALSGLQIREMSLKVKKPNLTCYQTFSTVQEFWLLLVIQGLTLSHTVWTVSKADRSPHVASFNYDGRWAQSTLQKDTLFQDSEGWGRTITVLQQSVS